MHTPVVRANLFLILSIISGLSAGCNRGPSQAEINGVITLDGKELETGTVRLAPVGAGNTAGGNINPNGTYEITAMPGTYRVEISATALQGGKSSRHGDAVEKVVQLVPDKYNTRSQLTLDVKSGRNKQDFALTSK